MSSSIRAPGDDSWLMHTVVLAGRQSPKYLPMVVCMASASRKSVKYFVTFTTSRQPAPTWSRIDLIASMARVLCIDVRMFVIKWRRGRARQEHEIAGPDNPHCRGVRHGVRLLGFRVYGLELDALLRLGHHGHRRPPIGKRIHVIWDRKAP